MSHDAGLSIPSRVCRHFGICGGCLYQDSPYAEYLARKYATVRDALTQAGLDQAEIAPVLAVPPATRRRASLKAAKRADGVEIGFHARRSHDIADMHECFVLTPQLFALVQGLRALFLTVLKTGEEIALQITQADNGFDLLVERRRGFDIAGTAEIACAASRLNLARVLLRNEIVVELEKPQLRIGQSDVVLPPGCFLQSTREGEQSLQDHVLKTLSKAKHVVDLFCGVGTFALPLGLAHRVHAVDSENAMLSALADAARSTRGMKPLTVEKRDLFRHPLSATELNRFDGVVLDPPRAGARAQCIEIARSKLKRLAYVSCNPVSFARDARLLADAGFRIGPVKPVDQFLWSDHIELAASFER